ncbi:uroporphyrinogen-III C-methyltransferase [Pseudaeromonas paramecii]|uniref:Uroporphyrinogen-III C-methyltransferase n=1 Tax=Pseudaeromonas paramecii TaxID=2138166 RepID=A0ABP8Q1E5_9GAMM
MMTEQATPPETDAKTEPQAQVEPPKVAAAATPTPKPATPQRSGRALAALALLLALGTAAGVYGYGRWFSDQQSAQLQQLQLQLTELKAQQSPLLSQLSQADERLRDLQQQLLKDSDRQNQLEHQLLTLSSRRPNDWLLAEADYLVRMAGRKLWLEHDVNAALLLLHEADGRIRDLNDPALLPVRKAFAADQASLQALPQLDKEGLVLRLSALIDNLDQLPIKGMTPSAPTTADDTQLSDSLADWRDNLYKSWRSFADNFISIRRLDSDSEALLSPDQRWYLKANLRTQLLNAQQAVYREQSAVYEDSLQRVSQWLEQYFDGDDSSTQFMQSELQKLLAEPLAQHYPDKLASQAQLEDLVQQRLQTLMNRS